jgi:LysM repeat protein/ABC-type branched-subunit amino acid transport system substrate-binding protein
MTMDLKRTYALLIGLCITATLAAQPITVNKSEAKITEGGMTFYLHTVDAGQTLFSIARAYEVNQTDIIRYNPTAETVLQLGQVLKIPDFSATTIRAAAAPAHSDTTQKHTIAPGETLFSVARIYGITVQALKTANPQISNFDNLKIGDILIIPQAKPVDDRIQIRVYTVDSVVHHEVQRGESLFGISRTYNVSQDSVISWNPELADAPLKRGQTLRIVYTKEVQEVIQPTTKIEQQSSSTTITYETLMHHIRDQETIWGLARRYNTTVDELMALNPELKDGLKKGHFIYVPVAKAVTDVNKEPIATSKGCEQSRYREKYKVALMIPLYLDEIDRIFITPGSDDQITKPFFRPFSFIEFYQGMLIALDSLKKTGLTVDLHVYDITDDTLSLKRILADPALQYMDLIIGPFFTGSYEVAARFAIQYNIKLVSPFARNTSLLAGNSNLFQMNAGSDTKLRKLAKHIAARYDDPRVILVTDNNEEHKALANAFRSSLEHHTSARSRKPYYTEIVYAAKGLAGVSTQLDATKHNVIVNLITGETMVSNYISNIARLSRDFEITMFGIPEWHAYRTFNLNNLMDVNLNLFATAFVDYEAPHTKHFLHEYRKRYKGEPEENYYAFMGYDIGMYFLSALHQFGLDFEACLNQHNYRHLGTGFIWQRSGLGYENTHLNLFRYHDFNIETVTQ